MLALDRILFPQLILTSLNFRCFIHNSKSTKQDCSIFADSNQGATTYESVTGKDLPYHSYSLVNNTCQNCYVTERYEDDDEDVFENVVELYEKSAKCEKLMNIFSPSERECSYVNGMDILELSLAGKLKKKGSIAAGFAIFFMMGLLFLTGSYAYFLKHSKYKVYKP